MKTPESRPDDEQAIARAFTRLATEMETAPAGWKEGVLSRLEQPPVRRRRQLLWLVLVPVAAAAALLLYRREPERLALATSVVAGPGRVRGGDARVGDELVVTAGPVPAGAIAILVYRDDTLVFTCGRECVRGARLEIRLPLAAIGRYRPVLVSGADLPRAQGRYDTDLAAFRRAAARIEESTPVDVH